MLLLLVLLAEGLAFNPEWVLCWLLFGGASQTQAGRLSELGPMPRAPEPN